MRPVMTDFRQKQGGAGVGVAEVDFCRGLEELLRDHLDGCMSTAALASCSSGREPEDDGDAVASEGLDQLIRRRRRPYLDGDEQTEPSAARRHHSRLISRWVAHQAQEMITTIEHRNRESELMALAGLHTVSMLDSSFLSDSQRTTPSGTVERPVVARASSVQQRWRELEDESAGRQRRNLESNRNTNAPESRLGVSESEADYARWSDAPLPAEARRGEDGEQDRRSSREQSPDLGEGERERVRQIVRGWMTENGVTDAESQFSPQRSATTRAEWLGESERERVRLVREWVQMASQSRDARVASRGQEWDQYQHSQDGLGADQEAHTGHIRRNLLRVRGRQARLDLIMRNVRERQRELQDLSQHRAVSDFPHRNRIQVSRKFFLKLIYI